MTGLARRLFPALLACACAAAHAQSTKAPAAPPAAPAAAPSATPKVFRCSDATGRIIYTDKPDLNCKTVRIDVPPPSATSVPRAAKPAAPLPKGRTVAQAAAPRTHKTHCAAISRAAKDFSAGRTGGMDSAAAEHRSAGVRKELSENCSGSGPGPD